MYIYLIGFAVAILLVETKHKGSYAALCLLPCAAVSSVLLAMCDNTVILSSCVLKNRDKEAFGAF